MNTVTGDLGGMDRNELLEQKREYYRKNKSVIRAKAKAYYLAHPEKWRAWFQKRYAKCAPAIRKYVLGYQKANKEKCNLRKKLWARKNKERVKASRERWAKKNPDFKRKWIANKRRTDVGFRILCSLRHTLWRTRSTKKRSRSCEKMLGCSLEDFRIYLESKFEVGMTWGNYGKYGWHIDHIVPCALFDLTREEHRKRCFHFSNLQPMFAIENHKKAAKSDGQMRII